MSTWTQLNKSVWQRVYADGTACICWMTTDGKWWPTEYFPDGGHQTLHFMVNPVSIEQAKHICDHKYEPQPELVERGDDWTFYRHGKRGAMTELAHGFWWVNIPLEYSTPHDTREQAEAAARKYVLGAAL